MSDIVGANDSRRLREILSSLPMAQLEREHGADFFALSLGRAIRAEALDVAQVFLDFGVDISNPSIAPVAWAVDADRPAGLRFAIDRGASVHVPLDARGDTPLHIAASRGDLGFVRMLLDAGADPNALNRNGVSPLTSACPLGAEDVVEALLAAGANPNGVEGSSSDLPLLLVAGWPDMVEMLVEAGADVTRHSPYDGDTAVHRALKAGNHESITYLVAHGADVNAKNSSNNTPLFCAPMANQSGSGIGQAVDALLRAGADPLIECCRPSGKGISSPDRMTVLDEAIAHSVLYRGLYVAVAVYKHLGWDHRTKYKGRTLRQWFSANPNKHLMDGLASLNAATSIEDAFAGASGSAGSAPARTKGMSL